MQLFSKQHPSRQHGLIFATNKEAQPFLDRVETCALGDDPYPHCRCKDDLIVVVSGMGPQNAAAATLWLLEQYNLQVLWNAGIAGGLRGDLEVGQVFGISKVIMDHTSFELVPASGQISAVKLPNKRLFTSPVPVFDKETKTRLSKLADLVDMEGGAIARVAEQKGVPLSLIKGVSDFAEDTDRNVLHTNLRRVSCFVADVLFEVFKDD